MGEEMNYEAGRAMYYQPERKARLHEERRYRLARDIYRDMLRSIMDERQRVVIKEPVDFDANAAVAVEAAEAFLAALEPPDEVLPDYVG